MLSNESVRFTQPRTLRKKVQPWPFVLIAFVCLMNLRECAGSPATGGNVTSFFVSKARFCLFCFVSSVQIV